MEGRSRRKGEVEGRAHANGRSTKKCHHAQNGHLFLPLPPPPLEPPFPSHLGSAMLSSQARSVLPRTAGWMAPAVQTMAPTTQVRTMATEKQCAFLLSLSLSLSPPSIFAFPFCESVYLSARIFRTDGLWALLCPSSPSPALWIIITPFLYFSPSFLGCAPFSPLLHPPRRSAVHVFKCLFLNLNPPLPPQSVGPHRKFGEHGKDHQDHEAG